MAASAWALYNTAKGKIGNGTIDLGSDVFYAQLFMSASNAATLTLGTGASVTVEVSTEFGYTAGGKTLSATAWAASGANWKFDSTAVWWSANGGTIAGIKYCVITSSTDQLLCYSQLSSDAFNVTDTNKLTVTPATAGIFVLS